MESVDTHHENSIVMRYLTELNSAQLQIVLLLECLRLHVETDVPLPRPAFLETSTKTTKRRKKVKKDEDMKSIYEKLIMDFIDRICIWNAFSSTSGSQTYSDFVEPILQN